MTTEQGTPAKPKKPAPRADFGAGVDDFYAKQPPHLRAILEQLRGLVEEAAPEARPSLKWGMPFYTLNHKVLCGLGAHKAHVNLILVGPATAFPDPDNLLLGDGRTGCHLRLTTADNLPRKAIQGWLKVCVELNRKAG